MHAALATSLEADLGRPAEVEAFAPGRIELIGNHTDYNDGFALSYAVAAGTCAVVARDDGRDVTFVRQADGVAVAAGTGGAVRGERRADGDPGWALYARGVLRELAALGVRVPPCRLRFDGDVPLSSGMSSSASLTMALAQALTTLSGADLEPLALARLGQRVENLHVGVPTGLLDQLSSLLARGGQALRIDFRTLEHDLHPLPAGLRWFAVDTGVTHALDDEYAQRRATCERVVALAHRSGLEIGALRDLSPLYLNTLRPYLSDEEHRRARHVVDENRRVLDAVDALDRGDAAALGALMHGSHDSSRRLFDNSCAELDALVDAARELPGHVGARLSGGGFGGITIHAVEADHADAYRDALLRRYRQATGRDARALDATPGDGAWARPRATPG